MPTTARRADRTMHRAYAQILAAIAGFLLVLVAWDEIAYAINHPYRFGPAEEIAAAAIAGLLLCAAVICLARRPDPDPYITDQLMETIARRTREIQQKSHPGSAGMAFENAMELSDRD